MIVVPSFAMDDMTLAKIQHDSYGRATDIIVKHSNSMTTIARGILEDRDHEGWGLFHRYDHRDLQSIHDILAAAWRWDQVHPELRLNPTQDDSGEIASRWLQWLRDQVHHWDGTRIRYVQIILANSGTPVAYAAETQLVNSLLHRHNDVAWDPEVLRVWELEEEAYPFDLICDLQGGHPRTAATSDTGSSRDV